MERDVANDILLLKLLSSLNCVNLGPPFVLFASSPEILSTPPSTTQTMHCSLIKLEKSDIHKSTSTSTTFFNKNKNVLPRTNFNSQYTITPFLCSISLSRPAKAF
ncbi:hypothetical protein Csa_013767 [Cucumis sativus]|uniref:Uncharacterized protein n=1 Tax=Cucumis sativus TaxID=3659 RepID=A0A0A0LNQ9_CUCSA|nr:hypothetical protein Csa_013767 [Cucumis sativus]